METAKTPSLRNELLPDYAAMLNRRHFQGALVRSGASVAMWVFALAAYLTNTIKMNHFTGITLSVLYLILINPPMLLILKHITQVRLYKYGSLLINFLEILGYTAIIYFLGGIEATFLTPIYAAVITYVGVVSPRSFPYIIAFLCSTAFSFVVVSEYFGLLPRQSVDLFFNPPWMLRLSNLSVVIGLLFVVAYISSLTAGILKKNRNKLREQNFELMDAMDRLRIESAERERTAEALMESEGRFRTLVEQAAVGVAEIEMSTGRFFTVNRRLCEMVGRTEEELLATAFQAITHPEDVHLHEQKTAILAAGKIGHYDLEKRYLRKDGGIIWVNITVSPLWKLGEKPGNNMIVVEDITDRKQMEIALKDSEQRYRELSIVDDLTQLYNSRHFYSQLKIELDRSNRYEQPLTLLLLDLDNFKAFNDTYGHVEGDQVLMRLGQVVKRCLRETDFAYRYGGEEFTIVLPVTRSVDGAVTAERIRAEFKKELFTPVPGEEVHMTVSIGLAQYNPQEEMKAFVHRVDQLMYQGKKNGKDRVCCES